MSRALRIALALVATLGAALPPRAQAQPAAEERAAERLLLQADRLLEQGNPEGALAELAALVERLPQSRHAPAALLRAATIQQRLGRTEQALATLDQLLEEHERTPEAAAGYTLRGALWVETAASTGDLERARTELRRVPTLFAGDAFAVLPARSEARVQAGEISLQLGDLAGAAADFVAALEDEPRSPSTDRARLGWAQVLLEQGEWQAAADTLERVLTQPGVEGAHAPAARRWLSLIHRLLLRPAIGQAPWLKSQTLALPDVRRPSGVATSDDGRLLLVDEGSESALLVESEGTVAERLAAHDLRRPFFDAKGRAFVATRQTLLAAEAGSLPAAFSLERAKTLSKVVAVERSGLGDWIVADREVDGLAAFDPTFGALAVIANPAFSEVLDLARDRRGRIYALDRRAGIVRLGLDRTVESVIPLPAKRPEALAVDGLGNLYVVDAAERRIEVYDREGRPRFTLGPALPQGPELKAPSDVAVDGAGRVYISDSRLPAVIVLE